MYKVFIQNKPLFFVNIDKIHILDGIFIPQRLANTKRVYILKLLENSNGDIPILLFSEDPLESIQVFFQGYDFIEAAGGIVKRNDKFLLIKRNGFWDIPKGKIEVGESPEESAIREIDEECGILCEKIDELITITYHTYFYEGVPTVKKTYWFALTYYGSKNTKPQTEEGISKVKWLNKGKVIARKSKTFPSIIDVIDQYFDS